MSGKKLPKNAPNRRFDGRVFRPDNYHKTKTASNKWRKKRMAEGLRTRQVKVETQKGTFWVVYEGGYRKR